MAKTKKIYGVFLLTEFGTGLQYVKADNKQEARAKFKKRFPKRKVVSVDAVEDNYNSRSKAI